MIQSPQMKALDDLFHWFKEYFWNWAVNNAYGTIRAIFIVSIIAVILQILNFAGVVAPSEKDSEYIHEIKSSSYTVLYCIGIIGDITFLFSLSAIVTRFCRDIGQRLR